MGGYIVPDHPDCVRMSRFEFILGFVAQILPGVQPGLPKLNPKHYPLH